MGKFKVGIIGCGSAAHGVGLNQKHMPSLNKLREDVEMTAFCDVIEERAAKAARDFGTNDAGIYVDYKDLLRDESLDIVHVCTPNRSHAEISIAALEAGKHVLCEKPMAKTYAEGLEMMAAVKKTGKKLLIGYQYRLTPAARYLQRVCRSGELGEIYYTKAHALRRRMVPTMGVFLDKEEQGGGPLIDVGTHALDMALWMTGNYKPRVVMASTYHKFATQTETGNLWGDWEPEKFTVEDSGFAFIRMENDATIILECSWALNILDALEERVTLCGTKAGADMKDGVRINRTEFGKLSVSKPDVPEFTPVSYDPRGGPPPGELEIRYFLDCIRNDTVPFVLPEEALMVTRLIDAVYESARSRKPVYL